MIINKWDIKGGDINRARQNKVVLKTFIGHSQKNRKQ